MSHLPKLCQGRAEGHRLLRSHRCLPLPACWATGVRKRQHRHNAGLRASVRIQPPLLHCPDELGEPEELRLRAGVAEYSLKGKGAYSEKTPRTPLHNTIYGSK